MYKNLYEGAYRMIDVFWGEFLLHPIPLEMSGNSCSHDCCYCFANIRRSCRVSEISRVINFLQGNTRAQNLATTLYNDGYPLCISNRTDPFSESNYGETRILAQILADKPNGLFIQTKLGREEYVDEFIDTLGKKRNIMFYITITTPNDDIAQIIEPGAPSPSERKRMAAKLVKAGYPVIVAFNPFAEGWTNLDENLREVESFRKLGINNFFYQNLHMANKEVQGFKSDRAQRFKKSGIDLSQYTVKATRIERQKYAQLAMLKAYQAGHNALLFGAPLKSEFFDMFKKTFKDKTFPTSYQFTNWMIKNKKPGDVITKAEYLEVLLPSLGDLADRKIKRLDTYILRQARNAWKGNMRAQNIGTFRELLEFIFDDKRMNQCPKNFFLCRTDESGQLVYKGKIDPHVEINRLQGGGL